MLLIAIGFFLACHHATAQAPPPCTVANSTAILLQDESATIETLKLDIQLRKTLFCLSRDKRVLVNAGVCPLLTSDPQYCTRPVAGCEDIRWDHGMCSLLTVFVQWAANDVYSLDEGNYTRLEFSARLLEGLQRPVKMRHQPTPDLDLLVDLPPQPPGMLLSAYDTVTFAGVVDAQLVATDKSIIPDCEHLESIVADYVAQKLIDSWYLPRVVCDFKRKLNYNGHRVIVVADIWKGGCYSPLHYIGNMTVPQPENMVLTQVHATQVWVMEAGSSFGDTTRRCKKVGIATLFLSPSHPGEHALITANHVAQVPGAFANWLQMSSASPVRFRINIEPDYNNKLVHVSVSKPIVVDGPQHTFTRLELLSPQDTFGTHWYASNVNPNVMVVVSDSAFGRQSISTVRTRRAFKYTCSTVGGDSGSPLLHETVIDGATKVTLVAVHESRGFPLFESCTALDASP